MSFHGFRLPSTFEIATFVDLTDEDISHDLFYGQVGGAAEEGRAA